MFTKTPVNAQKARRARNRNLFLPAEQTPPVLPTTGPPSFSYGSSNASFERPLDYAEQQPRQQQQQQSNVTTRSSYVLRSNRETSVATEDAGMPQKLRDEDQRDDGSSVSASDALQSSKWNFYIA